MITKTKNIILCVACLAIPTMLFSCARNRNSNVSAERDKQIESLIRDMDIDEDWLHIDESAAVDGLIAIGEPALESTLELLLVEKVSTRIRATRVIYKITAKMYGSREWDGWESEEKHLEWRNLWNTMGLSLRDDTTETCRKGYDNWKQWVAERKANTRIDSRENAVTYQHI